MSLNDRAKCAGLMHATSARSATVRFCPICSPTNANTRAMRLPSIGLPAKHFRLKRASAWRSRENWPADLRVLIGKCLCARRTIAAFAMRDNRCRHPRHANAFLAPIRRPATSSKLIQSLGVFGSRREEFQRSRGDEIIMRLQAWRDSCAVARPAVTFERIERVSGSSGIPPRSRRATAGPRPGSPANRVARRARIPAWRLRYVWCAVFPLSSPSTLAHPLFRRCSSKIRQTDQHNSCQFGTV